MQIYNTLTKTLTPLKKSARPIRMFVCGPTVYDYPHIGNARTYIAFDIITRYLRSRGYAVTYLQNITDVDDKIITRAHESHISWRALSSKFEKVYHHNEKTLNITSVSQYARATDYIDEIVKQVTTLLNKGFAYKIEGDGYYFDIKKFKEYGKLSGRTSLQADDAISRIDESVSKHNKGDFTLWKFSKKGEPSWETSLGAGRPGWHIEDTAITEHFFGPQYDVHGGALDLIFPHHEAEIAQQEAASGKKPFVGIWMHTGFLLVDGKKMSKSIGNFVSIEDFLKKYHPAVLRYIIASYHYRSPVDYTDTLAQSSAQTLQRIATLIEKLHMVEKSGTGKKFLFKKIFSQIKRSFVRAFDEDFHTPTALALLFEFIGSIEKMLWDIPPQEARLLREYIQTTFDEIFGISFPITKIPARVQTLAKERERARTNKQFMHADDLRKKISTVGYSIDDTPLGSYITLQKNPFIK